MLGSLRIDAAAAVVAAAVQLNAAASLLVPKLPSVCNELAVLLIGKHLGCKTISCYCGAFSTSQTDEYFQTMIVD